MTLLTKHCSHSAASVVAIFGLLALHSGCTFLGRDLALSKPEATASARPGQTSFVTEVTIDSDHLALDKTENAALSPQQLLDTVSELLAEQKAATARRFIQRYPDVAWELLRNTTADGARNKTLQTVAAAHDRQCIHGDVASGWQALLRDRAEAPDKYRKHDRRRADFLVRLRNGRPREALALGLTCPPKSAPGVLLAIDAWHLTGVALLLDKRPTEAADAFARAIVMAGTVHPYQAARLKLFLSDAQRRVGDARAADATWYEAVQLAGRFVTGTIPVVDPIFWERAAYLRPVDQTWPSALQNVLAGVCWQNGIAVAPASQIILASATEGPRAPSDEQPLWACIGCWRLDRDAPQAALVALKRAEAMTRTEPGKQQLQLVQAKALLALDQHAAATATLVRLSSSHDPQLSRSAMATLGTAKLQAGSTKQGFNLLRRAIEENKTIDWLGRAEAEADLGLAYLLVGSEQAGLQWLHRAQAHFESTGAHEHLVQSLENELNYLQQTKKKNEAKSITRRLANLEAI